MSNDLRLDDPFRRFRLRVLLLGSAALAALLPLAMWEREPLSAPLFDHHLLQAGVSLVPCLPFLALWWLSGARRDGRARVGLRELRGAWIGGLAGAWLPHLLALAPDGIAPVTAGALVVALLAAAVPLGMVAGAKLAKRFEAEDEED